MGVVFLTRVTLIEIKTNAKTSLHVRFSISHFKTKSITWTKTKVTLSL